MRSLKKPERGRVRRAHRGLDRRWNASAAMPHASMMYVRNRHGNRTARLRAAP